MGSKPVAIELFAGAGGLALGLEKAGFSVRALVEKDKFCCQTLAENAPSYFPRSVIMRRDIRRLSVPEFLRDSALKASDIDLISGGPPCQSFSLSAIPKGGRSFSDRRDELILHFVRFVKKIRPRAFLFENVPGMTSKSKGKIFRQFVSGLENLGYSINHSVINTANYGVPQTRRRLFVLGALGNKKLEFPKSTHGPKKNSNGTRPYRTISEVLAGLPRRLPNQQMPITSKERRRRLETMAPGAPWKGWRHRDHWRGPSRCILAHCRYEWVHPLEPRPGTVRELATLQTFPRDYVFCGPINSSNDSGIEYQYRQVGNSVPVVAAKVIGQSIYSQIDEDKNDFKINSLMSRQ